MPEGVKTDEMKCILCSSSHVQELGPAGIRPRSVTSDSRLSRLEARLFLCSECGHLQKRHTQAELAAIQELYLSYEPHHIARGREQLVFSEGLSPRPRTYHALEQIASGLPDKGRLLDVGTGNGAVLKSASVLLPGWSLYGFDLGDKHRDEVLRVPGVAGFWSGELGVLPSDRFHLIVLWHVLEHVPDPRGLLLQLQDRLADDGFLLIQVPDVSRTPFDLAVIDHCSHFSKPALLRLVHSAGYAPVLDGQGWSHNCLTLLLSRHSATLPEGLQAASEPASSAGYLRWLNHTVEYFDRATGDCDYAMFGTGMAGIWLSGQMARKPALFLDEDSTRVGRQVDGIPVALPGDVPTGLSIVMPFMRDTGWSIGSRLQATHASWASCRLLLSPPLFAPEAQRPAVQLTV